MQIPASLRSLITANNKSRREDVHKRPQCLLVMQTISFFSLERRVTELKQGGIS